MRRFCFAEEKQDRGVPFCLEICKVEIDMEETKEFRLPAVALRGLCILPGVVIHFDLSREKSVRAVEQAMRMEQKLFVVTQQDEQVEDPGLEALYSVGTVVGLKQMSRLPSGIVRVMVEGLERGRLTGFAADETDYLLGVVESMPTDREELSAAEQEARIRLLKELFVQYSTLYPKNGRLLEKKLGQLTELDRLTDVLSASLPVSVAARQQLLEAASMSERYELLSGILNSEIQIGGVRRELTEKLQAKVNKNQKDYLLREQLNAIREELGEGNPFSDADRFLEALKKVKADKEVKERIEKEISRFRSLAGSSSESAVERVYIETLLELPWNKMSKDNTDLDRAERILKAEHYGMEQVKERILEFLAVRSLKAGKQRNDSTILCLVGPPGTGKTSIARSVAQALDKKYVRISLGGVRDEAEIRGHRKTYVGAMPGRIATALKQAGVANPLLLLDEIDKVSSDYKGDTSAALLEVLDGEQNCRFVDHYVELPLDLSKVFFIATANSVSGIPAPLLDRMELIEVSSYTDNEKFHIAREHLLQKAYEKTGLSGEQLTITDGGIRAVIEGYTREAGVRGLERRLEEICRKAAKQLLQERSGKQQKKPVSVTARNLEKYLGKPKYTRDTLQKAAEVGVVHGLAWTSVGGETLQIEVNVMPGNGELKLTGQMGEVMKESAVTGLSYVRSVSREYRIPAAFFKQNDIHIHIPEGAVPKDGPSAGITMATAMLSAITGRKVQGDVAMTGEITLRGRVLPIGGLKEKILAAGKAGICKVLVPGRNRKDVEEISTEIRSGIQICFVDTMEDVLKEALV